MRQAKQSCGSAQHAAERQCGQAVMSRLYSKTSFSKQGVACPCHLTLLWRGLYAITLERAYSLIPSSVFCNTPQRTIILIAHTFQIHLIRRKILRQSMDLMA